MSDQNQTICFSIFYCVFQALFVQESSHYTIAISFHPYSPLFYRSAQEAQAVINKAVSRGQVMPSEARFDSNCITPGTEFMWKLQKQLKYFVHKKTTTDPLWQQVKVVLSGQDVRIIM